MALASQTARTPVVARAGNNGFKSPRQKRRQALVICSAAALVLIGAGVWAWSHFHSPSTTLANNQPGISQPGVTPPADAHPKEGPKSLVDKPKPSVDLRMGARPAPPSPSGAAPAPDPLARNNADTPKPGTPDNTPGGSPAIPKPISRVDGAAPAPAPSAASPPPAPADDVSPDVRQLLNQAEQAERAGRLVEARTALNTLLENPQFREHDKDGVRRQIAELNQTLLFSPTVAPGDPLTETYKIASGDSLVKLAKKGLAVEADLLQRVNKISDPSRLRIGQAIKLVHGPFHLVVHKSDFRADLYAGNPLPANSAGTPRADGSEQGWTFIRSFDVGLGDKGSTPTGTFIVRQGSKLKDPPWTNPRTGEKFASSDPKNPIGEHWLGLQGVDEKTKTVTGYGVHGTIAPESIGKEMSMGCVRLLPEDIALVWEMMQGGVSVVRIMP